MQVSGAAFTMRANGTGVRRTAKKGPARVEAAQEGGGGGADGRAIAGPRGAGRFHGPQQGGPLGQPPQRGSRSEDKGA